MKNRLSGIVMLSALVVSGICFTATASAQSENLSKKERKELNKQAVNNGIESKTYKILVTQATTQRGRNINLTSPYYVDVKPDVFSCDLPYFGESYAGTGYGGGGGVNFKSEKFTYEEKPGKKNGWDITVKPLDNNDVQVIQIYMGSEGFASISITFNTRNSMRYSGEMVFNKDANP